MSCVSSKLRKNKTSLSVGRLACGAQAAQEEFQTPQSRVGSPVDNRLPADGSPRGPAEVCRLCGFLLEIAMPLVFSGSVSVSDRSSVILRGHSSRLLFFFFGLEGLNHTKKKICKRMPECAKLSLSERTGD